MRVCNIEGCGQKHYAKGLCIKHYYYSNNGNKCKVEGCDNKCKAHGFCKKHWARMKNNGHLEISRREVGTGTITHKGYLIKKRNNVSKKEHRLVAEKALGKPLPKIAVIHHFDGDTSNNNPNNLVVCPDTAYHNLIHRRQRALEACGNPNYLRCYYCRQYDDPSNLYIPPLGSKFHRECRRNHNRAKD